MNQETNNTTIIGGGIVGLCTAWYLRKAGVDVTVIDKGQFTDGTSFGNAGMIVPSHFIPMATPGVITQGVKWLLDNKSPFYVRPRLDLDLMQWLWKFYRSANDHQVRAAMPVLFEFNEWSKQLYIDMVKADGLACNFEEKGLLMLYKTEHQAQDEAGMAEKALALGVRADILSPAQLRALEPEMDLDVLGGLYFPGDAHLHPNQLMRALRTQLEGLGVQFMEGLDITDMVVKNGAVTELVADNGQRISVESVIVASGSWTAQLLRKVGIKMLLQDGKGYSITLANPPVRPRIPTILTESRVAITAMGTDLRIGGTLELSGMDTGINTNRLRGILESVGRYYRNLEVEYSPELPVWKGYRPCTPDGMPYMGRTNGVKNLIVGTGHGMMGLSLGAATGKLLSQIQTDEKPGMDLQLFSPNRFG